MKQDKLKGLGLLIALLTFYLTAFGQNKESHVRLFSNMMDKIDFSLKQNTENKQYHFSLGYRLFAFNSFSEMDLIPFNFTGPTLTAQAIFGEKTVFTPKLGYRVFVNGLTLQADAGLNTDFKQISYSITPQVGLSLFEGLGIYYEYDYQTGKQQFQDIGKHRFGLFILGPLSNMGKIKTIRFLQLMKPVREELLRGIAPA